VDNSGNVLARYTQDSGVDQVQALLRSGTISYYQADGLGTITSLSNPTGTLAQTYTFDSFGNQTASSGSLINSFRYTAREFDPETNLYNYRARYLDPASGRFIGEDPKRFQAAGNFYPYVSNSPTTHLDPFGWSKCKSGNCAGDCPGGRWVDG
jgi:RHS repeat-associated protein